MYIAHGKAYLCIKQKRKQKSQKKWFIPIYIRYTAKKEKRAVGICAILSVTLQHDLSKQFRKQNTIR